MRFVPAALAFALALGTVAVGGCALNYTVAATPAAVGADAKITADVVKDQGITKVTIQIENLAPAERVAAGSTSFVVWARREGGAWLRVGALKYDEGARRAVAEQWTVPETTFELQVTAEAGPMPEAPSTTVVVTQKVN
jgi:hypothetical protein